MLMDLGYKFRVVGALRLIGRPSRGVNWGSGSEVSGFAACHEHSLCQTS